MRDLENNDLGVSGEQVAAMMRELTALLMREQVILVEDSNRVIDIVSEATSTLRGNFKQFDEFIRRNSLEKMDEIETAVYEATFQQSVSTLQFEDIVNQIVNQHIKRVTASQTVLARISELVSSWDPNQVDLNELLQLVTNNLAEHKKLTPRTNSVKQSDLSIGESELF